MYLEYELIISNEKARKHVHWNEALLKPTHHLQSIFLLNSYLNIIRRLFDLGLIFPVSTLTWAVKHYQIKIIFSLATSKH